MPAQPLMSHTHHHRKGSRMKNPVVISFIQGIEMFYRYSFIIIVLCSLIGCTAPATVRKSSENEDIVGRVDKFYTFLLGREAGNRHNDQDERFRKFFLDRNNYYDFLDSYLPLVRDRNLLNNTVNEYYVLELKMSEDGESADVKLKLLSRDAPLLYRKLVFTQQWFKTYGNWYPGKVSAQKLTRIKRITGIYTLPPKKR